MVKVGEDARKCVVYLGYEADADEGIVPEGTGFLVGYSGSPAIYLVTARHVAYKLGRDPFIIRLNERGSGRGRNIHVDNVTWYRHPDGEIVDVAAMEFEIPKWADVTYFPTAGFLSEEKKVSKEIGAGDLAYVVGVFALLYGKRANIPAVHTGHIILFPEDEPIPVWAWEEPLLDPPGSEKKRAIEVNGYLVAADTLPGSSGSPVFVRRSIERPIPKGNSKSPLECWVYGSRWLLGLWQGAWSDDLAKMVSLPQERVSRSLGIGSVVPANKIKEVLDLDELRTKRKEA